jgi:hypothetical protein
MSAGPPMIWNADVICGATTW